METKEFFSLSEKDIGTAFSELLIDYWTLELGIADGNGCSYSSLDLYGDSINRTCQICGTVCNTSNCGELPRNCENRQCASMREFWGVLGFPTFYRLKSSGIKNKEAARPQYLKTRMRLIFGCNRISEIPAELRFDFLLSTMVERIAHEANNRRP